jgi:DNA repair exonuclease SbcCD nuclease subunit
MRYLVSSDWHYHSFKAHSYITEDGANSRFFQLCEAWHEMMDVAQVKKCETIFIAGDLFQIRGSIKPSVFNVVFYLLQSAKSLGIDIVIIPGNHDMEDFKGGPTAVELFNTMDHVHVFNHASCDGYFTDLKIAGIPYQNTTAAWEEAATMLLSEEPDVWICHQGIDDFKPSAGLPDTSLTVERIQDILGPDTPAFFGHYHKPDQIKNIVQTGAPVQHNWGDVGQKRGVWFMDSEKSKRMHPEFIELTSHPKFVLIDDLTEEIVINKGDFVKLRSTDIAAAEAAAKTFRKTAGDVVIEFKKKYSPTHRKTVKVDTVNNMLAEYIALDPELKDFKDDMLNTYKEVCCD